MAKRNLLKTKLNQLFCYLYHKEKYNEQLNNSIDNNLCDFAIILLWKIFMLFVYEKLYQISDSLIIKSWEGKYEKKPKDFKENSLYWPNNIGDEQVINFLYELYTIDKNIMKMANSLAQKRDTAAHVSEVQFDIGQVDSFLDEIIKLCEKIQKAHVKYLEDIEPLEIDTIIVSKKLSTQDIRTLIDKLIKLLEASLTFQQSTSIRTKIINLGDRLSREDVKAVLGAIQNNSRDRAYHQILEANGAAEFLKKLYHLYNEPAIEWKEFAEFLVEKFKNQAEKSLLITYNWLFEIFGMQKFEKEEDSSDEDLNPEEIPF